MNRDENGIPEYLQKRRRTENEPLMNRTETEPENLADEYENTTSVREEVRVFLEKQQNERRKAEEKARTAKEKQEKQERDKLLISLGLYKLETVEVEPWEEYDYCESINEELHYFGKKKVALDVSDEYLKAIKAGQYKVMEEDEDEENEEASSGKSWAESFFSVIGILAWIAGVIWLIAMLATETFDFSMLLLCFMSGAVCMCASELFGWLVKIHRKLSDIADSLKKD